MQNYHIIKVSRLGATATRPEMVKLQSERFNQSITMPFTNQPDSSNPSIETAVNYLSGIQHNVNGDNVLGFDIVGQGEGKGHMYIISNTFEPIK